MLYKETIAVCSENSTKPLNTLYEQNSKLLNAKQVYIYLPFGLKRLILCHYCADNRPLKD
jgi:hypothetical protein